MTRAFLLVLASLVATACATGSGTGTSSDGTGATAPAQAVAEADHDDGELGARPLEVSTRAPTGEMPLPGPDEGILYVPPTYRPREPAPLAISLHGCCGEAGSGFSLLKGFADPNGLIVIAPQGSGGSWDVISGGFGPDVELIDLALAEVFATYNVDPDRIAIAGFSDGASYALSLGLTNGDLFTHVIAHSPGFMATGERKGRPRIFIAHGTEDRTLPIENTRRIVQELEREGYPVRYEEFPAGHQRQPQIFGDAVQWFTGG